MVWLLIYISPSNVPKRMLLQVKYFQNCQDAFGRSECKWVNKHFFLDGMCTRLLWDYVEPRNSIRKNMFSTEYTLDEKHKLSGDQKKGCFTINIISAAK